MCLAMAILGWLNPITYNESGVWTTDVPLCMGSDLGCLIWKELHHRSSNGNNEVFMSVYDFSCVCVCVRVFLIGIHALK